MKRHAVLEHGKKSTNGRTTRNDNGNDSESLISEQLPPLGIGIERKAQRQIDQQVKTID